METNKPMLKQEDVSRIDRSAVGGSIPALFRSPALQFSSRIRRRSTPEGPLLLPGRSPSASLALAPRAAVRLHPCAIALLLLPLVAVSVAAGAQGNSPASLELFERRVRPVLAQHCYSCHSAAVRKQQGGLELDSRAALLKGGISGPIVVAGKPDQSRLILALHHTTNLKMPPGGKLPPRVIADLEQWVTSGAAVPADAPKPRAGATWETVLADRRRWWSLLPVRNPALPIVRDRAAVHPVDRFLQAQLEREGLKPAVGADPPTQIRRVALVLTGLPPTPAEVSAFLGDTAPGAYERMVDRYLASPHFGERWARHWMDVVRFGETYGYEWNYEIRDAWRYRDYLIRAFNQDLPYDRFVREHVAGDRIAKPRWNQEEKTNESLVATAFYRFGEVGHDNFREIGYDPIDNQIDTLTRAFQATTVACARCHDHKLDAVSMRDYYGMFGVLTSARQAIRTLDAPGANAPELAHLAGLKQRVRQELGAVWLQEAGAAGRMLLAAEAARKSAPDAATLAAGLDPARLKLWTDLVKRGDRGLDDPLYPWHRAAAAPETTAAWRELVASYEKEGRERAEFNRTRFTPFGEFGKGDPAGWQTDGLGLRGGPSPSGEFILADEGDSLVTAILPAGLYTHGVSRRLNGALRSPTLPRDQQFVSVQVLGGQQSSVRMIPDFRQLGSRNNDLKNDRPAWVRMGRSDRDEHHCLEIQTKVENPLLPERGARGRQVNRDDPRSYFGVVRAVLHNGAETPKEELDHLVRLLAGDAPAGPEAVAERYTETFRTMLRAWMEGKASDADARMLDWLLQQKLLSNSVQSSPALQALATEYRTAEKQLQPARVVAGMTDVDSGQDFPILQRGDFRTPGDMTPRRFLEVLSSSTERITAQGSGRLELAERIADPANPLTARVFVNRVWHYLFGAGLVRTTDDFGHMGEMPSHPELRDWLASRFVGQGPTDFQWSPKRLIRSLLLTQAFRRSGRAAPASKEKDPENRLLQHYPTRRLEAEGIRDSLLAVSGRLDRTFFGPSLDPYREKPYPDRKLVSGTLDGDGRRSIYMRNTLMEGPRFLCVFNFPEAKVPVGRRDVTNVPAQALTLLNDPFVLDQANVWAARLVKQTGDTPATRIAGMFEVLLARKAAAAEVAGTERLLHRLAEAQGVTPEAILTSQPLWKDLAHTLFNLKEFLYIP